MTDNPQTTQLNYAVSKQLQLTGMAKAASYPHDEPVARARDVAIMLAVRHGEVWADMVHEYLAERLPEVLQALDEKPNCWGSVFNSPKLKFSGRIRESSKVSRHCGVQRIWVYSP